MELKIIIRKGWKLLVCISFLTVILLSASVLAMQAILDDVNMEYTLETYASVGTIYPANADNAVYSPLNQDVVAFLEEAESVQSMDIRDTVSAKIPGTDSVPCYFAAPQTNHLVFFRGTVKDYKETPGMEGTGFAAVRAERIYGGQENWILPGEEVYVGIIRNEEQELAVEEGEEYLFLAQSAYASQLGLLENMLYAYHFTEEYAAQQEFGKDLPLYHDTIIRIPEEMSGEEADAYAEEILKERGLEAYVKEIENLNDVFTVHRTEDMQMLIPVVNETMFFVSGRGIRMDDAGKKVCVISRELAQLHDFQVGDRIELSLGNGCYTINGYESGYPPFGEASSLSYGAPQEYEIVGIYAFSTYDPSEANLLFGYNDIFLPFEANHKKREGNVYPYSFSFRVSGENYDAFLEEAASKLADMGYVLQMSSSRWEEVEGAYHAMERRRASTLMWAGIVFVSGTVLYVLLLYMMYKREFALRQLFGARFSHSVKAYLTPFAVSSVSAGVLAVTASDLLYLKKLMPQAELTAPGRIPANAQILGVLSAVVLIWMALAWVIILITAKRSEGKALLRLLK